MTTTVRILGSRAREQMPGTSITLLAPGFRGALAQRNPGVVSQAAYDLPFAAAAAGAEVRLAAQLTLQLEARPPSLIVGLRSRSALVTHPRVIVPRRPGVMYAVLQTDEDGISSLVAPQYGDDTEAVFQLKVARQGSTQRTLRVLMWPEPPSPGPGPLAITTRWETLRRPYQLAQRALAGIWQEPDWPALAGGPVLLLMHDTFSTPQATFADWLDDAAFTPVAQAYQGRILAFGHPTLAAGIDDNLEWLVPRLAPLPGPFDMVGHGRGGLLARAFAVDGRLPLRRVCQVGAPNQGTPLARGPELTQFLDAHLAMLAHTGKHAARNAAQSTLEGVLALARATASGGSDALPGVEALTPEHAIPSRRMDFGARSLDWFTVGGQFALPERDASSVEAAHVAFAVPTDGVVPTRGCHEPGIPVKESLHLTGVHHHGYFSDARVHRHLASWLL
jgi:hypothetical protein